MSRGKRIFVGFIIIVMSMCLSFTAFASGGGSAPKQDGQTDIIAGVVVDYMRKLKFIVMEKNTTNPIPEASIEIYIPSLDRYVLLGVTDENGVYELPIVHVNNGSTGSNEQFVTVDGTTQFQGGTLFLYSENLKFRAYKSSWLPYPHSETVVLDISENPQVIKVYLHKEKGTDPTDPDPVDPTKPTNPAKPEPPDRPGPSEHKDKLIDTIVSIINNDVPLGEYLTTGGIPKTGVEGAIPYWIMGLIAFLLAGGIMLFVIKKDRGETDTEQTE